MSWEASVWAMDQRVGDRTAKLILLHLARYASHDGIAYHSYDGLARVAECSRSTAVVKVKYLIDHGFIERTKRRRSTGDKQAENEYRLSPGFGLWTRCSESEIGQVPGSDGSDSGGPEATSLEGEETLEGERASATVVARARNPIWDTLDELFGQPVTPSAKTRRGKVCRELKQAGATPDVMRERAAAWPRHFEGATLTEMALLHHWERLGRPPLRGHARRYGYGVSAAEQLEQAGAVQSVMARATRKELKP
jgi:hypothetical protein